MGSNNLNIDFYRVKFNILQQEEDESGNLTNGTDPTLEMLAKNMAWMHTNRFDLCLDDASLYHYGTNAVNDVNLAHAFISNKAKFHKSCKNRYIDSRKEKLKQKLKRQNGRGIPLLTITQRNGSGLLLFILSQTIF